MVSHCIRHTDLPHTTRLFSDFSYHFDRVARFYGGWSHDPDSFRKAAAALNYPADRRAQLVAALAEQNKPGPLLDLLARDGTVAVVTGQQVGLFSGPAYTVYKALTAVKLARRLTSMGIDAVPVFWLATEDHDLEEINHCWVFDAAHKPHRLDAAPNGEGQGTQRPVGTLPLPESVPADALRQAVAELPFGPDLAAFAAECYRPGECYGDAFRKLLHHLLGANELLYLDPMRRSVRELAAPVMREAVAASDDLRTDLLARNAELIDAGYHAQVHVEPETSLFFLLENGRRVTLRRSNGSFASKDARYERGELAERAAYLSPNAVLRPVVQDWILPTVAYIGGPAELAYLAQSQVIYSRLLGRMPVAVSRSGFTIVDARSAKLMERYGLALSDLFHGEDPLRDAIARKLIPTSLTEALASAQRAVGEVATGLERELEAFDKTLVRAARRGREKIDYQIAKLERKAGREALRRSEKAAADASHLYHSLFPDKHPQERLYSILPFLAQHGTELVDRLYENVHLECPDHIVLVV